ncbi:MAG: VOC family protein, partial [Candidatus Woesearchaeota archaeon]|nr:VOC family protein [Candidatus Woesearchaeota archaeon]
MQKIIPFLWFDDNAEEAAKFYVSLFNDSNIQGTQRYDEVSAKPSGKKPGSVMTVSFKINGMEFGGINGGPLFKLNPSVSFFTYGKTVKEVDELYHKLSKEGEVMMPLDRYPFSERYAFFKDKFGVSWQVMLSKDEKQIVPCLLFVNKKCGKAEDAVKLYTKLFDGSKILDMQRYGKEMPGMEGKIMYSSFMIGGMKFAAMDGPGEHKFDFNESSSFLVRCKDQEEADYFWDEFTKKGEESMCGWLKDEFGVSWQIVPDGLNEML